MFESRVFHNNVQRSMFNVQRSMFNVQRLHHRGVACGTEDGTDDVTEDLEDCLDCSVHSITFFEG